MRALYVRFRLAQLSALGLLVLLSACGTMRASIAPTKYSLASMTGGRKAVYSEAEAKRFRQTAREALARIDYASLRATAGRTLNIASDHTAPTWDWRSFGRVTPARDQQGCGACWGFAAVGMLEISRAIVRHELVDAAEQDLVNCEGSGCGSGVLHSALEYLMSPGLPTEAALHYQARVGSCVAGLIRCYKIVAHDFVAEDWGIPSDIELKRAIASYGGIGTFIFATDQMLQHRGDSAYDVFDTGGDEHFVVIIGWDDNKPHGLGKGAWLIKNSWGPEWGSHGFGWIPYGANSIGLNAQWAVADHLSYGGCP